jgi:hypothetical protein
MDNETYTAGEIVEIALPAFSGLRADGHFTVIRRDVALGQSPVHLVRSRAQTVPSDVTPSRFGGVDRRANIRPLFPELVAFERRVT